MQSGIKFWRMSWRNSCRQNPDVLCSIQGLRQCASMSGFCRQPGYNTSSSMALLLMRGLRIRKPPQCLQATSQVVLGYSGQKYLGPFAFLCCELHTCPPPRAQPAGGGHGFYWFYLCRLVNFSARVEFVFSLLFGFAINNFLQNISFYHTSTCILVVEETFTYVTRR